MSDTINIEILPDGTLKIITDKVSAPNHINAEKLIGEIIKDAGGEANRVRRTSANQTTGRTQNQ